MVKFANAMQQFKEAKQYMADTDKILNQSNKIDDELQVGMVWYVMEYLSKNSYFMYKAKLLTIYSRALQLFLT